MLVVLIILVFPLRINIFRLCRLVLDIFPNVLRIIFKNEFQQKFCCLWEDNPTVGDFLVRTDRWQARLGKAHLNYLQNGNSAEWDSTVLFHVLLHSSLCLFADKSSVLSQLRAMLCVPQSKVFSKCATKLIQSNL